MCGATMASGFSQQRQGAWVGVEATVGRDQRGGMHPQGASPRQHLGTRL